MDWRRMNNYPGPAFRDGILPNILHDFAIFCIHVKQGAPHKHIWKKKAPLRIFCSWTHLPSSRATISAHAISACTKVTRFGYEPSCCICPNSSTVFCPCPHFHVLIWWWSKCLQMEFCWRLSKHLQCSHILHTCQARTLHHKVHKNIRFATW